MDMAERNAPILLRHTAPVEVDVAVVGGGPTGAMAALAAAKAGWRTAMVAPLAPHDPRTTALLMPAIRLLDTFGVWQRVEHETAPLITMRLIDDTERLPRAPEIAFDSHEIGFEQFGFNTPNNPLNKALADAMAECGAERIDAKAEDMRPGQHPITIVAGEHQVKASLVVAADGSNSKVRALMGFSVRRWPYDQSAFVTTLSHERPHGNTSTEFHTAAGPFTLVPLPGNRSSLVWVGRPDEVARWAGMDPEPLAREIEKRAHSILGRMSVDGPRGTIPMEGMMARRFGAEGVVLVGEAGHRFPPIGAQGLNLGMRDVEVLYELLKDARAEKSLTNVPRDYDRKRRLDVTGRTIGVDLLNRSLLTDALPVTIARTAGLTLAANVPPLRKAMMRFGLG